MQSAKLLKKKSYQQQLLVSSLVKPASELQGLTFGNRIDELLKGGLAPHTFTFLYGIGANHMMNALCANSVRIFGGRAMFIDAANCFDPYSIVDRYAPSRGEKEARKFIESIIVSRAFTCYQLRKLVAQQLLVEISKSQNTIKAVFVTGISSVFNEQDNTREETERLQLLMAQALRKVALDKTNGVLFVVASSAERCENFFSKCDSAIKLFATQKEKKKPPKEKAILMKHYTKRFATIEM
jgi:RecA/RadA recombinase